MNYKELLEERYSKETIMAIAHFLVENQQEIASYLEIMKDGEAGTSQRAAWAFGHAGIANPKLVSGHIPELLKMLEKPKHQSISRNIYRVMQFIEIPEKYEGVLYDLCIRDLMDPKQPIAVKCFGMTTAFNICKKYPELQPELKLVIEENLENASAGYRSRARKILPKLA